jgi:putative two-component system protein, hydrogenase maturation factor HypX/HoxX
VKILFLTSAHNSLSQRLLIELTERGHCVHVTIATSDDAMLEAVKESEPELIVAPMLKVAISEAICSNYVCMIVHPGVIGDRGASALDWAITNKETAWGATVLQADAEWDAGPIWASRSFPMPTTPISKSALYRAEVTEAAVEGVLEAVEKFQSRCFCPEALDYSRLSVRGRLRPTMCQKDRAIDWAGDDADTIVRKINAGDSAPGVLDSLFGTPFFLYGAHNEDRLRGASGQPIAQRYGAVCVGTVDGAIWISHLKAKAGGPLAGLKLPAALALGQSARRIPSSLPELPSDYRTFQEIRYSEEGDVGRLYFNFYNGAMSTAQCYRLRDAFLYARSRPTRVIELLGGRDFFSNGIHLNVIEAASDPALESWCNINAIDDLVLEILNTMSHLVVTGFRGNAGAGGAMMALAADYVYAREGVVLNPHYKSMGGLYGSEYWTYTLPRRVGAAKATELTDACRPIGAREAKAIGFVDECFGRDIAEFERLLKDRTRELTRPEDFWRLLREKHEKRLVEERVKPLACYRAKELEYMWENFHGADDSYHVARQRFVFKGKTPPRMASDTPEAETPRGLLSESVFTPILLKKSVVGWDDI